MLDLIRSTTKGASFGRDQRSPFQISKLLSPVPLFNANGIIWERTLSSILGKASHKKDVQEKRGGRVEYILKITSWDSYWIGPNYVSSHGDGWSEMLDYPWTTSRLHFAKRFQTLLDASDWAAQHPLRKHQEYRAFPVQSTAL